MNLRENETGKNNSMSTYFLEVEEKTREKLYQEPSNENWIGRIQAHMTSVLINYVIQIATGTSKISEASENNVVHATQRCKHNEWHMVERER